MFIGEILCLFVYFIMEWRVNQAVYQSIPEQVMEPIPTDDDPPLFLDNYMTGWSQLWFLLPTLCDLTATTLMNIGLIFVSASIYQMLRGSVVLFTGIFSTLFLGIKHPVYRWFGLIVVFLGVAIVGLSSMNNTVDSSPLGIFFVVLAQCFTATQFVIEEKLMHQYTIPPIKAVGLEGFFGLLLTVIAIPALHFTLGIHRPPGNIFDMNESLRQLLIPQVLYAGIGICISISFFNWCGLAVTKNISATSRSTIDTCRTLFIWICSLLFGWESFKWLQVVGFIVLIYGYICVNVEPLYLMMYLSHHLGSNQLVCQ
jgi:drug/metabolite transporter (DMT)-like permease